MNFLYPRGKRWPGVAREPWEPGKMWIPMEFRRQVPLYKPPPAVTSVSQALERLGELGLLAYLTELIYGEGRIIKGYWCIAGDSPRRKGVPVPLTPGLSSPALLVNWIERWQAKGFFIVAPKFIGVSYTNKTTHLVSDWSGDFYCQTEAQARFSNTIQIYEGVPLKHHGNRTLCAKCSRDLATWRRSAP